MTGLQVLDSELGWESFIPRKMLVLFFIWCTLLPLGLAVQEAGDHPCPLDSCCNTTLKGLPLMYCRDTSGFYSVSQIAPPQVLNVAETRRRPPPLPKELLESSEIFTLRMLDLNVFGVRFESETVAVRMEGIKRLLENSLYDLVLVQEAW